MNALKKTQEDLQKGRQKLDDMLQRLEREQVVMFLCLHQLVYKAGACNGKTWGQEVKITQG